MARAIPTQGPSLALGMTALLPYMTELLPYMTQLLPYAVRSRRPGFTICGFLDSSGTSASGSTGRLNR
jgi:hypothetical protein